MNTRLAVLAMSAGLMAVPAIAAAQATTEPLAMAPAVPAAGMAPMKPPAMSATVMCRPAMPNEKSNATMGSQALVCKTMDAMMSGGMMMVPDAKSMKGSADADRAWRNWLSQSLIIPAGGTG